MFGGAGVGVGFEGDGDVTVLQDKLQLISDLWAVRLSYSGRSLASSSESTGRGGSLPRHTNNKHTKHTHTLNTSKSHSHVTLTHSHTHTHTHIQQGGWEQTGSPVKTQNKKGI